MIRRTLFAVALLALLAVQTPARAQWGCGDFGYGGYGMNYYGYGMPVGWYTGVQGRMPPYFALHPPVYYSGQIVRIPYGASPFARPWGVPYGVTTDSYLPPEELEKPAPEGPNVESTTIQNPFFEPGGAVRAPKLTAASRRSQVKQDQGLMIENPYYRPTAKLARQ